MSWYTFITTGAGAAIAPEESLDRLWKTMLFRSPEVCLFAGNQGPLGRRYYLALPEMAEDRMHDYLSAHKAEKLRETPTETVMYLVGIEERAWELWGERTACDPTSPEGCEMCSG